MADFGDLKERDHRCRLTEAAVAVGKGSPVTFATIWDQSSEDSESLQLGPGIQLDIYS